jgi:hypothetical protein
MLTLYINFTFTVNTELDVSNQDELFILRK